MDLAPIVKAGLKALEGEAGNVARVGESAASADAQALSRYTSALARTERANRPGIGELKAQTSSDSNIRVMMEKSGNVTSPFDAPIVDWDNAHHGTVGRLKLSADGFGNLNIEKSGHESPVLALGERTLSYRKVDSIFFLYEHGAEPERVAASMLRGNVFDPNSYLYGTPKELKPVTAHLKMEHEHDWRKFNSVEVGAVREAVPVGSIPTFIGSKRQAWLTPSNEAVVIGPDEARPNIPFVLQPYRTELVGEQKIEWFKPGDSASVTTDEFESVVHKMRMEGWKAEDHHRANYVKLEDGSVWRVDPEAIFREMAHFNRAYRALHIKERAP